MERTSEPMETHLSWLMWICAGLFFFYQFVLRVSLSVIAKDLMKDLEIDPCEMGQISSYYYYGYAFMQIPVGLLLDRFGVRRPLLFANGLCFTGTVLFATAESPLILSLSRFLMGAGSAFGFLSCMKTITLGFPATKISFLVGLTVFVGTVGGTSGSAPLAILVDYVDWRQALFFLSAFGLCVLSLCYLYIHDGVGDSSPSDNQDLKGIEGLRLVLRNPYTWIYGGYSAFMYIILSGFADLWGASFFMDVYSLSRIQASWAASLVYVGIAVSGPSLSWVVERLESHIKVMRYGAIVGLLAFGTMLYGPKLPINVVYLLLFLTGWGCGAQFFSFAAISIINPRHLSGRASSVNNMMGMGSGIIFQPLIGYLLSLSSGNKGYDQVFELRDYITGLSVIPLGVVISLCLTFFMKETFPKKSS